MTDSQLTSNQHETQMDWQQVVLNGGPPCFFVEGPQYCGRAERWQGHGNTAFHDYVSLDDLLTTIRQEERRAAIAAVAVLPTQGTMNYRRGYEEGVRDAIRTLEVATNETKGEATDGPTESR